MNVGEWGLLAITVVCLGGGGFALGVVRSARVDEMTSAGRAIPWVLLPVGVVCLLVLTVLRLTP